MAQVRAIGGVVRQLAEHVIHQGIEVGEGRRAILVRRGCPRQTHLVVRQSEGGLPAAGTVQACMATPMVRLWLLMRRASAPQWARS